MAQIGMFVNLVFVFLLFFALPGSAGLVVEELDGSPQTFDAKRLRFNGNTLNIDSSTGSVIISSPDLYSHLANGDVHFEQSDISITESQISDLQSYLTSEVDGSTTNEIQNLFQTFSASSGTNPVADSSTDTLALAAGTGITVTGDSSTDTITIASTVTDTNLTQEEVEDYVGALVTNGSNTTVNYDDVNGALSIASTVSGGGSPGGSNGQVQYNDDGSFGGSSEFVWDDTNNRLGIGIVAPSEKLDVDGSIRIAASGASYKIGTDTVLYANGDDNLFTGVGVGAGAAQNGSTTNNIAIGFQALENDNNGDNNTAMGFRAAENNAGDSGIFIGYVAGQNNTGDSVTLIGRAAGSENTADNLSALGFNAGRNNTGSHATAIGHSSAQYNNGNSIIALGFQTLFNNNGNNSIAIGFEAGELHRNGDRAILIGYEAEAQSPESDYALNIGDTITGNTNTNEIAIGFGSDNPDATLEVGNGSSTYIDGTNDLLVADDVEINGNLYVDGELAAGTYTAGSVIFSNGNNLTEDSSNFYWDVSNKRLGLGMASPAARLHTTGGVIIQTQSATYGPVSTAYDDLDVWGALYSYSQDAGVSVHAQNSNDYAQWTNRFALKSKSTGTSRGAIDFIQRDASNSETSNVEVMSWLGGGNVGIGNIDPSEKLEVNGSIAIAASGASYKIGSDTVLYANGNDNYFTGVGVGAGNSQNGSTLRNTAIGYQALYNDNNGDYNTAIGYRSAYNNTGDNVTAAGHSSAQSNTGNYITATGNSSAQSNTGNYITATGNSSARYNSGSSVTATGMNSASNNTGDYVTTTGRSSAYYNNGNNIVALGYETLYNNNGNNSIAIGHEAGELHRNGTQAILIGYEAEAQSPESDYALNIGDTIFGKTDEGKISIGTPTDDPIVALQVNGAIAQTSEYDVGRTAGTTTIDPVNGNKQKLLLTQDTTLKIAEFSGATGISLLVTVDNGGSHAITFNGDILFPGGTSPTITTANGSIDFINFEVRGNTRYGQAAQDFQ